jgi:hypothetical protein
MDDKDAFLQLSAVLTGLYGEILSDDDIHRKLNEEIATEYARLLAGEFNDHFRALLDAYKTIAPASPPSADELRDDALLTKLRQTQAFKDNEVVAKQIVNVWYFSQFNDKQGVLTDGGFYERGYVWRLIRSHPIGFSTQLPGYWAHEPETHRL